MCSLGWLWFCNGGVSAIRRRTGCRRRLCGGSDTPPRGTRPLPWRYLVRASRAECRSLLVFSSPCQPFCSGCRRHGHAAERGTQNGMMDRGDQDRLGLRQNAARVLGIARSLFMYYGNPLSAGRLRRFYTPFVPSGSVCFDIGAHTGNRVRCWRSLGARVVAVEPQLDFVKVLRALYGRDAGVTIVSKAVGAKAGAATLYVSPRTPTVTTLSAALSIL